MFLIESYILNLPTVKINASEKKEAILDQNKNIIGYVKRFYRNPIQKILSYSVSSALYPNIYVEDAKGNLKVKIELKSNCLSLKPKWIITVSLSNSTKIIELQQIPKMTIPKRFKLKKDNKEITVIDTTIGVEPKFCDEEENLLAKCKDKFSSKEVYISIFSADLDIYLVSGICYLIYIL